jgi:hypothetical protein
VGGRWEEGGRNGGWTCCAALVSVTIISRLFVSWLVCLGLLVCLLLLLLLVCLLACSLACDVSLFVLFTFGHVQRTCKNKVGSERKSPAGRQGTHIAKATG